MACSPTYNVSFTTINVGSESAPVEFAAVMDSGTSFTYLNDPEYTALGTSVRKKLLHSSNVVRRLAPERFSMDEISVGLDCSSTLGFARGGPTSAADLQAVSPSSTATHSGKRA